MKSDNGQIKLERCKLYTGSLFFNTFLSMSLAHHIIFERNGKFGTDIFTGKIYPVSSKKGRGYHIGGFIYPMDEILENAGYDELLTEKDKERMFNEDCERIFLQSELLKNIEAYADETYYLEEYKNNHELVKSLFLDKK